MAAGLVALLAVVLRGWQVSQRTFYWDDLAIPDAYSPMGLATLFQSYDGHIMPASAFVQWAAHQAAPLEWWLPASILVGLTALVAAMWWKVALELRGRSWSAVVVFAALMFSPFLMAAAGWWSAGLNALAWQAGMAAVLLCMFRPRVATSVAAAGIVLVSLLFTEKALSIVPAAWALALLLASRPRWTWFALPTAVWAAWAVLFTQLASVPFATEGTNILQALPEAVFKAIIPGSLGGAVFWERWHPSPAFAAPPTWWSVACALILVSGLALWVRRDVKRRIIALLLTIAYLALILLALVRARTGDETSGVLTLNLHYYADWFTFSVLALACCPARPTTTRGFGTPVAAGAVVCLGIASTATWVHAWRNDPTADYLANLRSAVIEQGVDVLDQPVDVQILLPVLEPHNHVSAVTGIPAPNAIGEPRMIDSTGAAVEAGVVEMASNKKGNEPECGTRVFAGQSAILELTQPLPFGEWTWELNAAATRPVHVTITTPNGLESAEETDKRAVTVRVDEQLKTQWVRVPGGGGLVKLQVSGPVGASVCVGTGAIGGLFPVESP
ncbi:MAG TPA: hypothetical protein H9867_09475 [Candidatus Corynebacterium gallistercoris]|uniref:Uncharacterized protein n=1 Tax=Candidatus Corynebacterium gallistercoris TaxID=2838530 RepID=A0A9D1UR73_9CORY|nr:hypothetical protein [Candidatus Corynebacterium gallistercoris]